MVLGRFEMLDAPGIPVLKLCPQRQQTDYYNRQTDRQRFFSRPVVEASLQDGLITYWVYNSVYFATPHVKAVLWDGLVNKPAV